MISDTGGKHMDLVKIGKYIAGKRKDLGMTQKQKRLKYIIGILLVTAAIVVLTVGIMIFRKNMPQNFIVPVDKDSIEMKTAEMLSGVDGAFMYKYTATNEFKTLYIHIWQYREGKLVDRQRAGLSYEGMDSPQNGTIIIVPQFKDRTVKIIIADDESQGDMLIPILEDVPEGEHYGYGRAATEKFRRKQILSMMNSSRFLR